MPLKLCVSDFGEGQDFNRLPRLLSLCVLNQHNITRQNASAKRQFRPVRGPVKTEQINSLEPGYLVRRAIVQRLTENIAAVRALVHIG